ncbi:Redoxin-domain-containing protein [Trichocladium antarcticum]|uniref:Redoxin-domain-containing protein n=1 Tax=Trichocladium antarcticum TaxID=1450529 RepID=A0AAN6UEH8_9PEZI|nr:Redoxin-domain-containing protein [Trichocladium antarcticum]
MFRPTALRPIATMAKAAATRPLARRSIQPAAVVSSARGFHGTARAPIKVGDALPDTDALMEHTPGTRVNLAETAQTVNRMLVIGVPAAFSPGCSTRHVPGYINHPGREGFEEVVVVGVNDVFVMKAWGETLDPAGDVGIRFLADPTGQFTKMLDMAFDGSAIFGGDRSKRYTIVVEQGKVKSVAVEPDNTGLDVSLAEKVLGPA